MLFFLPSNDFFFSLCPALSFFSRQTATLQQTIKLKKKRTIPCECVSAVFFLHREWETAIRCSHHYMAFLRIPDDRYLVKLSIILMKMFQNAKKTSRNLFSKMSKFIFKIMFINENFHINCHIYKKLSISIFFKYYHIIKIFQNSIFSLKIFHNLEFY